MHDVIVIGGGVIGLSLAYRLAGQGVEAAVLDQGALGQESSWAGAGILPPGNPQSAKTPEARLRAASHVLWPELADELREATGIDNGYGRNGGLEVRQRGPAELLDVEVAAWRAEGVAVEPLSGAAARQREPALHPETTAAYRLPELGQVRNPRHLKALVAACAGLGVSLLPGTPAYRLVPRGNRIAAVETCAGLLNAGQFVVAGGAWSSGLLGDLGPRVAVRPLRGQLVLLAMQPSPIEHVINVGARYLVPRGDGRVLVGSTEEVAGFDKRTTAAGVGGLVEFAIDVVPALAGATFERAWAGLRPQSADGLPYLGRVGAVENLFVAAGHFRAGLQLSPITAELMTQLLIGRQPDLPLEPYWPDRATADFGE